LAETLRWLQKAVLLDPRDPGNHQQIGRIFMTLGKAREAEWWFRRSLELQPGYEEARHQLGYLYLAQNKIPAAIAEVQQILSGSSESPQGLDLAAAIELKQGNYDKAAVLCQKTLEQSSMGASYLTKAAAYRLAYILWVKGRKNEGGRLFDIQINQHQDALKKGDQSWVPRFFLASIHAVRGESEMACTWLKKAIEAGFRNSGYFDLYGDWNGLRKYQPFKEIISQFKGDLEKMRRRAEALKEQNLYSGTSKPESQPAPNNGGRSGSDGKE